MFRGSGGTAKKKPKESGVSSRGDVSLTTIYHSMEKQINNEILFFFFFFFFFSSFSCLMKAVSGLNLVGVGGSEKISVEIELYEKWSVRFSSFFIKLRPHVGMFSQISALLPW